MALPLALAGPAGAEPNWRSPGAISISGEEGAARSTPQLVRGLLVVDPGLLLDRQGANVMDQVAGLLMAEALGVSRGGWSALLRRP